MCCSRMQECQVPPGSLPQQHKLACLCHLISERKHYLAALSFKDASALRKHAIKLRLARSTVKLKPSSARATARLTTKAGAKRSSHATKAGTPALGHGRGDSTPSKAASKIPSSATRKTLFRQSAYSRVSWSYRFSTKGRPLLDERTDHKCLVCLQEHQHCSSLLQHVL
jgi:hypothetical protein